MHKRFYLVPAVVLFALMSCTTMGDYDYSVIDNSLESGSYQDAYALVESDSKKIYSSHDEVLRSLDLGLLSHYAGEHNRSNKELTAAERKMEEYFTKSVTQAVSSYIVNDTVVDYAGEVFEDIYTNIFMALNYIHLGDIEGAFVEIRRFDNKLRVASAKYTNMIAEANKASNEKGGEAVKVPDMEFHNSAMARYLSMILYRSRGELDSATIDMKYLDSAYTAQPKIYNFSKPASLAQELNIPASKGRLNLVAFTGHAPIKEEVELRLFSVVGDFYYKIAFPEMKTRPSVIKSIQVTAVPVGVRPVESTQEIVTVDLEPLESISNIAMDTFAQRQSLIYLRAVVRSLGKATTTAVWGGLSDNSSDAGMGALFSILQLASAVATEVSERADVRASRYFPATAWVTGINLDPGEYLLNIEYKNSSGAPVATEQKQVKVSTTGLNLVESVCLK